MSFGLKKEIDDFFYLQFVILFLVGFGINAFTNGQATLVWIDEHCSFDEGELDYTMQQNFYNMEQKQKIKLLKDTYHNAEWKNKFAFYVTMILYWIVSPLINFYYAIFVFKKKRKIYKVETPNKNTGDNKWQQKEK